VSEDVPTDAEPLTDSSASADELSELFFAASADERRLILHNLEYTPLPPAPALEPAAAADAIQRLENAALAHLTATFVQEIEYILQISRVQARRLVDDHSGEPIVVVASVLGMPAEVLQRILLCLNPHISQSVQQVYELVMLHEEIDPTAARRLLAIWRASSAATAKATPVRATETSVAPHQPHYWHVERRERRADRPGLPERPKIRWEEHEQQNKAENG